MSKELDIEDILSKLTKPIAEWDGSSRFFCGVSHMKFIDVKWALESELVHKRIPISVLEETATSLGLKNIPRNGRRTKLTHFIIEKLSTKAVEKYLEVT